MDTSAAEAKKPEVGLGAVVVGCIVVAGLAFAVARATTASGPAGPGFDGFPAVEDDGTRATLLAGGDLNIGRKIGSAVDKYGFEHVFGGVRSVFEGADLVLANLEVVITDRLDTPRQKNSKKGNWLIHAEPKRVELLKQMGIGVLGLANNHTWDYLCNGLEDSLKTLAGTGIPHGGAGRNITDASKPVITKAGDLSVGVIFFSAVSRASRAEPDRCGIQYLALGRKSREATIATLAAQIRDLRQKVDLVFVSPHWGTPYKMGRVDARMIRVGRAVIDAGAHGGLGHGNHKVAGMETYKGRPILYDMGNFLFDQSKRKWLRRQAYFRLVLSKRGVESVEVVPYGMVRGMRAQLPEKKLANIIKRRVRKMTGGLGSRTKNENGRMFLDLTFSPSPAPAPVSHPRPPQPPR